MPSVPSTEIRLQFKNDMPFTLELILVNKYGFRVIQRNKQANIVIYGKTLKPAPKKALNSDELDEKKQNELIHRINKIVNFYECPENYVKQIKIRLHNLAMCYSALERQFILDWMGRNVKEDQ